MSRIIPIGDDADDDESDAGPQDVGTGHASFEACEPSLRDTVAVCVRAALRLRAVGATKVVIGDLSIEFGRTAVVKNRKRRAR